MNVFLLIGVLLVVGGLVLAGGIWVLEKAHRLRSGQGDKVALIGIAAAIAGLPLLVVSLIYAFA